MGVLCFWKANHMHLLRSPWVCHQSICILLRIVKFKNYTSQQLVLAFVLSAAARTSNNGLSQILWCAFRRAEQLSPPNIILLLALRARVCDIMTGWFISTDDHNLRVIDQNCCLDLSQCRALSDKTQRIRPAIGKPHAARIA